MGMKKKTWLLILLVFLMVACITAPPTAAPADVPVATDAVLPSQTAVVVPSETAAVIPSETAAVIPSDTPVVETALQSPAYAKLLTYQGEGFSFQYPANAQVENVTPANEALSEVHISGPAIYIEPGDADYTVQDSGYSLTVETYRNPSRLDAEAWVLARIGKRGEKAVVAGYPACWYSLFGGDSNKYVYYVSNKDRVIAFSFIHHPVQNEPVAEVQLGFYALMMGTFTMVPPQGSQPSENLQTYQGQGFSLRYPANARVENATPIRSALSEVRINGPDIFIKPGDADWTYQGPGYQLTIQTFSNPAGLDVETWARNYLTALSQESQGGPLMGPLLKDGQLGALTDVAGYPAFWTHFFGGDSTIEVFYLSNKDQVVELSFSDYPLANQPIALVQQDMYALLMGTFRFADGNSASQNGAWAACPNGYLSRLRVGNGAHVSLDPPLANLLRESPEKTAQAIGSINPGEGLSIIEGPACSGGWTWWKVKADKDGSIGWTSEGDENAYWLIPY